MDMINTSIVSTMVLSSSSSVPLASSMGSSSPLKKWEVEDGPFKNRQYRRTLPSPHSGPMLTCYVLITELVLASPEFFTAPESFGKLSDEPQEQSVSSIEIRHGALVGYMFNSMDEVPTLLAIFMKSLTLTPQELGGEDLDGPSSLALVAGGLNAPPLNILPLEARPPSPYEDLDWEADNLLVDKC